MKYIIIIISLYIISSCRKDDIQSIKDFPQSTILNAEKPCFPLLFKNGLVYIYDTLIIMTDTHGSDYCIHVFNKNTLDHISSTGRRGRGPNEISSPGLSSIDKKAGIIWCRDMEKHVMWKINIADMLSSNDYPLLEMVEIPDNPFFIQFENFNENTFSFSNTKEDILISYFNHQGQIIDSLPIPNSLRKYDKKINETSRISTSNYIYSTHPNGDKHAIAFRFTDVLTIVDTQGKVKSMTIGPYGIKQKTNINDPSVIVTNWDIISTHQHIYCLYSGRERTNTTNGTSTPNFPQTLHVYNWKGDPVARFNLEFSVMSFDIDYKDNEIVTFCAETGEIIYYSIPTI